MEELDPGVFEVEFCDHQGRTYAMLAVSESKLMVLYHQPVQVASWLSGSIFTLRDAGYRVALLYYWLESPDLAVARVAARVRRGGDHVPEATIRQRWTRSVENLFRLYLPLADEWSVFNNTHDGEPRLVAVGHGDIDLDVHDPASWNLLMKVANHD